LVLAGVSCFQVASLRGFVVSASGVIPNHKWNVKDWACIVGAVMALLWGVYIWPTPYQHYKSGSKNYRVNRFNDAAYVLDEDGWSKVSK
jgi:hypothetical protein